MADMQELIARLEAADGVTHSLEVEFATHLYENQEAFTGLVNYDPEVWLERNISPLTSLDAALALAERVMEPMQGLGLLHAVIDLVGGNGLPSHRIAPLFCAAILKAKAQGEGG